MSIQPSEEERSGWTERGGGRGLSQRAVMQIQPLNSPAGKRKTNSFMPKIANKFVKSLSEGLSKTNTCDIYIYIKFLFSSVYSCNSLTSIKGCIRHERPLLAAEVLTSVARVGNKLHPTQGTMT